MKTIVMHGCSKENLLSQDLVPNSLNFPDDSGTMTNTLTGWVVMVNDINQQQSVSGTDG